MKANILVADDEANIVSSFTTLLEGEGYPVEGTQSLKEAESLVERKTFDIVLLDLNFPGESGLQLLKQLATKPGGPLVLVISGQSDISTAVEALRLGAADYLEKPVDPNRLLSSVNNLTQLHRALRHQRLMTDQIEEKSQLIGESPVMKQLEEMILRAAQTDSTVLITGENGTGKELAATRLFLCSQRRSGPFVKVNCPGVPATLFESELFGHRKGAFTGAVKDYPGKFRMADSGTIFLDEIGDLPRDSQAKLLRVLESGEVETLGAEQSEQVDVRVICATNRNLHKMVEDGLFRKDLYYRISILEIGLPPLRERRDDIPILAGEFLRQFDPSGSTRLAPGAIAELMAIEYPGNVRQLRNLIERLTIFFRGNTINSDQISAIDTLLEPSDAATNYSLHESVQRFERNLIAATLRECDNNISRAARMLGVDRANLSRKIKDYGLAAD